MVGVKARELGWYRSKSAVGTRYRQSERSPLAGSITVGHDKAIDRRVGR